MLTPAHRSAGKAETAGGAARARGSRWAKTNGHEVVGPELTGTKRAKKQKGLRRWKPGNLPRELNGKICRDVSATNDKN